MSEVPGRSIGTIDFGEWQRSYYLPNLSCQEKHSRVRL